MTYDGLFHFGGAEVINAERGYAYLDNLAPGIHQGECCSCGGLGVTYSSPEQDGAPWYSPYSDDTADFLGVIPLAVDGTDDSTWTLTTSEKIGTGSYGNRGRRAGRDLRFKVLATALSPRGMSAGLSWLRETLIGASDGCTGVPLRFLTDCPACCETDPPSRASIMLDIDYRSIVPDYTAAYQVPLDWSFDGALADPVVVGSTFGGETWISVSRNGGPGPGSMYRELTGLTPGAKYIVYLDAFTTSPNVALVEGNMTVSVAGTESSFTWPLSWNGLVQNKVTGLTPGPRSFSFVATDCRARLVFAIDSNVNQINFSHVQVVQVAPDTVSQTTVPGRDALPASAWRQIIPVSAVGNAGPYTGDRESLASWRWFTTATTFVADTIGATRALLGLTIGKTYRVAVRIDSPTFPARLSVRDGATVVASTTIPTYSWGVLTFVATAPALTLRVTNDTSQTPTAPDPAYLVIREANVVGLDAPAPPAAIDRLVRHFEDVLLTSGPSITSEQIAADGTLLTTVEWTMRANVPDMFGEPVLASSGLGDGALVYLDPACSQGAAVRTNLVANPSGEYAAPVVTVGAGTASGTNPVVTDAISGTHVLRLTSTASATSMTTRLVASRANTAPGTPVTISGWVRVNPGALITQKPFLRITLSPQTSLGPTPVGAYIRDFPVDSTWTHFQVTFIPPPSTPFYFIDATLEADYGSLGAVWQTGNYADLDALLVEEGVLRPGVYFDGDSVDGSWTGAAGSSTSVYSRSSFGLIYDPDCPPPPAPPRPPAISSTCFIIPSLWQRYAVFVPESVASYAPRSAPRLVLTTGATAARLVRVRFYDSQGIGDPYAVDPCSFSGEFIVSYLPPNSSLYIDAATQSAWFVRGDQTQDASSMLFATDGGPIVWPVLTRGEPYIITVDLDSTAWSNASGVPLVDAIVEVVPTY